MPSEYQTQSPSQSRPSMETGRNSTVQSCVADEYIPASEESQRVSVKTISMDVYAGDEILFFISLLVDTKHLQQDIKL